MTATTNPQELPELTLEQKIRCIALDLEPYPDNGGESWHIEQAMREGIAIGRAQDELRGEYICWKCGLRQDSPASGEDHGF